MRRTMLERRIATAVIAGAFVVAGIFLLPPAWVATAAAAVALAAAWEWARLAACVGLPARLGYLVLLTVVGCLIWQLGAAAVLAWLGAAVLAWLGVAAWLLGGGAPRDASASTRWQWLAVGLGLLPPLALALALLAYRPDEASRGLMLYVVGLVWVADIGAFFAGRRWGRHALAPRVSAGKTREGLIGGVMAVLVYALVGAWLFAVPGWAWAGWFGVAVVAALLSVVGDLFESVLKREAGVKDSGALLPGHGGLLDRIDSLIAATPAMVVGLAMLGRGALP
jgi:phosphatidate cytidylyltransferase